MADQCKAYVSTEFRLPTFAEKGNKNRKLFFAFEAGRQSTVDAQFRLGSWGIAG